MDSSLWFSITVASPSAEERGHELLELGSSGIEVLSDDCLKAFFYHKNIGLIQSRIQELGFVIQLVEVVPSENWLVHCEELWRPITLGSISIHPQLGSDPPEPQDGRAIALLPATGFGTGHHATTAQLIETLDRLSLEDPRRFTRALDIGTGSGILALVSAQLFPCQVLAIDNDPLALENAAINLSLNPTLASRIQITRGSVEQGSGKFDLILCNLYFEIIATLLSPLLAKLTPEGHILLSGIQSHERSQLEALLQEHQLAIIALGERDGWIACHCHFGGLP